MPVSEVTDELRGLIDDMFETMHAAKGIGLAAPQVGRSERLTVVDVDGEQYVLINPEVVEREGLGQGRGRMPLDSGRLCRRRAGHAGRGARHGRDGEPYEVEARDLLARCIQHEIDHLFGTLFIDHLSVLKRRNALSKWTKEKEKYPRLIRRLDAADVAAHHHRDEEL